MFISQKQLEELKREAIKEVSEQKNKIEKELNNLKEDHKIILERKDKEVDNKLYEKTNALRVENDKLRVKEANLQKEVDILNKAFENLGFDVKDMKDILNKLVDGLVAKNQIQLVK